MLKQTNVFGTNPVSAMTAYTLGGWNSCGQTMFHRITTFGNKTGEIGFQLNIFLFGLIISSLSFLDGLITGYRLSVIGINHMTGCTTGCPVITKTIRSRAVDVTTQTFFAQHVINQLSGLLLGGNYLGAAFAIDAVYGINTVLSTPGIAGGIDLTGRSCHQRTLNLVQLVSMTVCSATCFGNHCTIRRIGEHTRMGSLHILGPIVTLMALHAGKVMGVGYGLNPFMTGKTFAAFGGSLCPGKNLINREIDLQILFLEHMFPWFVPGKRHTFRSDLHHFTVHIFHGQLKATGIGKIRELIHLFQWILFIADFNHFIRSM